MSKIPLVIIESPLAGDVDLLRARIDTDRALVARGSFYDFLAMAWNVVEPSPFVGNWHLEEMCAHLEAVSRGEITRLVINIPPGTGKSSVTGVFWTVWEWILRPATKWIFASYDASLVGTRDGGKVIKLLESDWFKARWGTILPPGKAAASRFENLRGGFRFATSIQGGVTGRHADIQVVDDPLKPKDASGGGTVNKAMLRTVRDWWSSTMSSRMVSQVTGRRVIVMQRLCHDDLAGTELAGGGYVHLRLPMRFEPDWDCKTHWGGDRRTVAGDLLFRERFPEFTVARLETKEMGPTVAAAQLQQRPQVQGGGTFKRAWFQFWDVIEGVAAPCTCEQCWTAERDICGHPSGRVCAVLPDTGFEALSWDMTFKGHEDSDYVAGGAWRITGEPRYWLLDCFNERADFLASQAAVVAMSARHPKAFDKLIENKANGPAIENTLRSTVPGIVLVEPSGSKEARASACQPEFAAGQVFVPHPRLVPWVWPYLKQVEAFPKGAFDDMVDQTSQLIVRYKAHGGGFSEAMRRVREGMRR